MSHAGISLALVALLGLEPSARAEQEPATRRLTLQESVDLALRNNVDLIIADEEVTAAIAAKRAIRGNFGPKGRVEFNAIRFDDAYNASFSIPNLPFQIPPFQVREDTTTALTLTAVQPLGALWTIFEGHRVRDIGVDVARIKREASRRDVAFQTTEAFYRTLQVMQLAEVARLSVAQLESQATKARSFYEHGYIAANDMLRVELGLTAARQRLIQAEGTVPLAQGKLALLIGASMETAIVPVGEPVAVPLAEGLTSEEVEHRAFAGRVEVRELEARIQQAYGGVRVAMSKMLPDVNALIAYQHNTGSLFMPADALFGGVNASWNFWEWGATYYGIPEAQARHRQALAARAKVRDGVRLEARSALVTARSAFATMGVARSAVTQAEENYRLESKRYEARTNTSFDVIDAETLLTQARSNLQTATYDYVIARAALLRAMGESPSAQPVAAPPSPIPETPNAR